MSGENEKTAKNLEKATFAAGCFWGVEESFRTLKGVVSTRTGYIGGHTEKPSYEQVCMGGTGHSEAVEISYDPSKISYDDLLHVFWNVHNPTEPVKTQYKSVIFYHSPVQKASAETSLKRVREHLHQGRTVLTEILPVQTFYQAEEYHQQYILKSKDHN